MNVVLVGGGKAAVILLDFFVALDDVKVVGVCDPMQDAPGIVRARSLGIPTTTRSEELVRRPDAGIIIELTGNSRVREDLIRTMRADQEIMSAGCARLMCDMIVSRSAQNAEVATTVSNKFESSIAQLQTAIETMDIAYVDVEKLLREGGLVSLNAKIECARAGDAGNAFAIVVNRMHEMLSSIRGAMEKIANASSEGHRTLASLSEAKDQLAEEFRLSSTQSV